MNKRGASHADWAISLGIFLLYILSMLMIIQPGVEPFYREDQLLKIATDHFKENTAYSFYKTPLIINVAGMELPVSADYMVTLNDAFPFSGDVNNYAVTDALGVPLPNFRIAEDWSQISFDAFIDNAVENKFYIISNKPAIGVSDTYSRNVPVLSPEITDTAVPTANFTLTIGSTEATYGVSESLLARLVNDGGANCMLPEYKIDENYVTLKGMWKYPTSKDLSLYYVEDSSPQYEITDLKNVCAAAAPYAQANVFVEEWATRMFTTANGKTGEVNPIRMGVKVW
ncbi:MAG: hypothetical protein WC852_04555 [Candidatus Nanoarchaeia archaeon]|jgi:hypothetical protein